MSTHRHSRIFAMLFLAAFGLADRASGVDGYWIFNNTGTANWSDTNKWSGFAVADGIGATAWITNNITATRAVTLDGPRTLGVLHIGDSVPTHYAFSLGASGTGALTFNNNDSLAELNHKLNALAQTISAPLVLAGSLDVNNEATTILTLSGGLTGSGNLVLDAQSTGGFTISTKEVNPVGVISNVGVGNGVATITGGVGSNVTAIIENSTNSALTISTAALNMNSNRTVLINDNPSGIRVLTLSGGTTNAGDLVLRNNSAIADGITLPATTGKSLNHAGRIINEGSGPGNVLATLIIGSNVTSVIQDSPTSILTLGGVNVYTNGCIVRKGTLRGLTAGAFGIGTSRVTLGDTNGSADVTLVGGVATLAQPILVAGGNTGMATITNSLACTFSGPVTLDNHDLFIAPSAVALTMSGGIIGTGTLNLESRGAGLLTLSGGVTNTGNIFLSAKAAGGITLSTKEVNPVGVISNVGVGAGLATISGGVGSNVTAIVESSTNSALTISTAALAVNSNGTTLVNDNTSGVRVLTLSGGTTNAGDLVLRNNSSIADGILIPVTAGKSLNHAGRIINEGSGTSNTITMIIGPNVTGVIQDSLTSVLTLGGVNVFNGVSTIRKGTLRGTVATAFGAATTPIVIGDSTGSADATLVGAGAVTHANPITVAAGNSGVASITPAAAAIFSGGVLLDSHSLVLSNSAATLTLSGGITGAGNLTFDIQGANAITLSTKEVNPIGVISNIGVGAGVATFTGGVGSNVTAIVESSTNSALTISTAALAVNSNGTTLVNDNTSGVRVLTLSGGTTNAGDLVLRNNSSIADGILIPVTAGKSLNHAGRIINDGSGTSNTITMIIGPNVTGVIQDSLTSVLTLGGVNVFNGVSTIRRGTLRGTVATAFGAATSPIVIGDSTGSADATLVGAGAVTHANPITVAAGNSGVASITPAAAAIFSGGVLLDNHNLVLSNAAYALTLSGGITGAGNLIFDIQGANAITLSTKEVNPVGVISNIGVGAGVATFTGGVGSNVTAIVESSTNSALTISTLALVVNSNGTTLVNDNTSGVRVLTLSGGTAGTGDLELRNNSRITDGILVSTLPLNHSGRVFNTGTGTGTVTITGGVGSNVTVITENSASSALTINTGALSVNGNRTILVNDNPAGSKIMTVQCNVTNTGDLVLRNNSAIADGITFLATTAKSFNHSGKIINEGVGSGNTYATLVIATNVTGVVQDSLSSMLTLAGVNVYTSGTVIKKGTLRGNVATAFGAASSPITIGDVAGGSDATLLGGGAVAHAQPITVAGGNTGVASITPVANATFSGAVTLNSHDLVLSNTAATLTLSGGITGTGNLLLDLKGGGGITVSTKEVNPVGVVSNVGAGSATGTISGGVGANVQAVVQASASSPLIVSTKAVAVNGSGTELVNDGGKLFTLSGGTAGSGNLVLRNNSATTNGLTVSTTTINHTGTVVNAGTGPGGTLISAVIGPNVTAVTQDSETSVLTLSGANTFTTGLVIGENKTVRVANTAGSATGTGEVDVNAGGTLDGSGIISGAVELAPDGTLSPSTNNRTFPGKLTVGSLVWHGGGVLDCVVGKIEGAVGGADYGQLVVSGNLTSPLDGSNRVVRLDTLGRTLAVNPAVNYGLKLVSCTTAGVISNLALSSVSLDTNAFLVSGGTWVLTNTANALVYQCINVPPAENQNYWIAPDGIAGDWSDSNNWMRGHAPLPGEDVVFDMYSSTPCWLDEVSNNIGSITVAEGYGSTITFWSGYPGEGFYPSITVTGNVAVKSGVLKHLGHSGGDNTAVYRLVLDVGGDFLLASNATINLDGLGYALNRGPGAGSNGVATLGRSASHGGLGEKNMPGSTTYGSVTQPESLGSGAGGAGGGAFFLRAGGSVTVNGTISAQGLAGAANTSAGSGGSIYIRSATIGGSGTLRAGSDPSASSYYGSGGGRIAVIATNGASIDGLTLRANPSLTGIEGGGRAGTVYLETTSFKRLVIDQENIGAASTNYTVLPASESSGTDPAIAGPLEDVTLVLTNGAFAGLARDLRMGDIGWLDGTLALKSCTLYLKALEPAGAFPADYGNGAVSLPGICHTFENGDSLTRDGRLLWGNPSATWRVITQVYQDLGGTATNLDEANEGYFAAGRSLVFAAASSSPDWFFRFWDGSIPAGSSRYDNPLAVTSLASNLTLRAWFVTNMVDLTSNRWLTNSVSDDWTVPYNWELMMVPTAGQAVTLPAGSRVRLTAPSAALGSFAIEAGATLTFDGWSNALEATTLTIEGTLTHLPQTVTETNALGEWVPQHRIWLKGQDLTVAASGVLNADYKGYLPGAGPGTSPGQPGTGNEGMGYGTGGGGGYGGIGAAARAQIYGLAYGEPADPWQPGSGGGYRPSQFGVYARPAGGAIRVEMTGQVTVNGTVSARGQDAINGSSGSGGGIAIYCQTFRGAASGWVRADGGSCGTTGGSGGGGRIALHFNSEAQTALPDPRPPVRFSAAPGVIINPAEISVFPVMGTLYLTDTTLLAPTPTAASVLNGNRFWHVRLYLGSQPASWSPASLAIENCVVGFAEGFTLQVGGDLTLSGTQAPLSGSYKGGLHLFAENTGELFGSRLLVGGNLAIGQDCWFYPHTVGYGPSIVGVRVDHQVTVANGGGINADREGYMPDPYNTNGPGASLEGRTGGSYGGLGGFTNVATFVTNGVPAPPYGLADVPHEAGSPGAWRGYGNYTGSARGGGAIHLMAGGDITIDGLLTANGGYGVYYSGYGGSGGSIFLSGMSVRGGATGSLSARGGAAHGGGSGATPGGGGRIAIWQLVSPDRAQARIASLNTEGLTPHESLYGFNGVIDVREGDVGNGSGATPGTVRFLTYRNFTIMTIY